MLAVGALFAGVMFHDYFIGEGYDEFWKGALFTLPDNDILHEIEHVPLWVELSPVHRHADRLRDRLVHSTSARRRRRAMLAAAASRALPFLLNKWYFDELYDFLFVRPAKRLGRFLWKKGDGGDHRRLGPNGVAARVVDVTNRVVSCRPATSTTTPSRC